MDWVVGGVGRAAVVRYGVEEGALLLLIRTGAFTITAFLRNRDTANNNVGQSQHQLPMEKKLAPFQTMVHHERPCTCVRDSPSLQIAAASVPQRAVGARSIYQELYLYQDCETHSLTPPAASTGCMTSSRMHLLGGNTEATR